MTDTAKPAKHSLSRSSIILICLYAVYLALTFIGAMRHEIWYDEGQAWNIARDNDLAGIVAQMQYEGHPPLWHFLLHIFTSIGCTADVLPFISWTITSLTAGLILWKAPFSPVLKGLLLFSGGFMFYWSVNSRVYCLILPILVLIAMVYKKRNDLPIVYGLLAALLANTHIMMCGLVGILGIFMIIDLFTLWKSTTVRQNIMRLLGLFIAGLGVIALVAPLLLSFNSVNVGNDMVFNLRNIFNRVILSFFHIVESTIMDSNDELLPMGLKYAVDMIFSLVLILMLIFLRHYRRPLIIQLVFMLFYIVVSEVLWFSLPPRGAIFIFMFVFVYWLTKVEPENKSKDKTAKNGKFQLSPEISEKLKSIDSRHSHWYGVLLCVYCAVTIPIGSYILFADYATDYSQSKKCAEFVQENISPDAVFVVNRDLFSQYSAYLPEYKFYSMVVNDYITYSLQTKPEKSEYEKDYDEMDYEKAYEDLKDIDELYLMDFSIIPFSDEYEVVYHGSGCLMGAINRSDENVTIYKIDIDRFTSRRFTQTGN